MSNLKKIPGIGDNMEKHLQNIGIHCIADLRGKDPEVLYEMDCLHKGFRDDRRSFYRGRTDTIRLILAQSAPINIL